MALRTYWCVLSRKRTTAVRGRIVFGQVDQFTCELDLDLSHTIRAAFLNGLRQHAGEEADPGEYRMYVWGARLVSHRCGSPPPGREAARGAGPGRRLGPSA
jgi:hypothetical protein